MCWAMRGVWHSKQQICLEVAEEELSACLSVSKRVVVAVQVWSVDGRGHGWKGRAF